MQTHGIEKEALGIIVLSHGTLARAIIESSAMLLGDIENVAPLCLYEGMDPSDYLQELTATMGRFPQGAVVLVDLFGGTPCNTLILHARSKGALVPAISGVNLPMLIEVISLRHQMEGDELLSAIEQIAHESIVNISKRMKPLIADKTT